MQALDSPHTAFPAVHIAGTKGKGSTVSMLSSILKHSGYTVGTYTSPHIVSFYERISINGTSITPNALDALLSKYKPVIESSQQSEIGALSHFEVVTALAFRYFADSKVDIAVIETGLGGARDATNILPAEMVAAAVISAVGHDHAGALGGSIETIAAAKAGIMKQNRPVVLGRQPEIAAGQVLVQHARENNLFELVQYAEKEVKVVDEGKIFIEDGVAYQRCKFGLSQWVTNALNERSEEQGQEKGKKSGKGENFVELDVRLRLVGKHQLENACTAITTAATLATSGQSQAFSKITTKSIIQGLENSPILPGRFQICRLEANQGLAILDGAHTPESAAVLVDTIRALFPFSGDKNDINRGDGADKALPPPLPPVALVLAMASDKDLTGVCRELRQLRPNVAVFTEVPIAGGKIRSAAPGALVGAWQASGMMTTSRSKERPVRTRELIQASIKAAVARAASELKSLPNGDKGVIVVTGSMHAVGTALRDL